MTVGTLRFALAAALVLVFSAAGSHEAQAQASSTAFAKKGTRTIGGDISIDIDWVKGASQSKRQTVLEMSIQPGFGYFVADGLAIKAGPIVGYASDDRDDSKMALYGAFAEIDYYKPIIGTVFFALKGGVAGALGEVKVQNSSTMDVSFFDAVVGPGLTVAFGGDFGGALSLDLLFKHSVMDMEGSETTYDGFELFTGYAVFF